MITAQDLTGHWRRDWLKAPGVEDHETEVHWFQGVGAFIDIRIPADLPDCTGAAALADLPPGDLAALMRSEGFAGHIRLADNVCTWTRTLNWHGLPGSPDVGRLEFGTDGALIETGVHADYRELWQRPSRMTPKFRRFEAEGRQLLLLWTSAMFMVATDVPNRPAIAALRTLVGESAARAADIEGHFTAEFILGHWDGEHGVARLSTNPLSIGTPILRKGDLEQRDLTLTRRGFTGQPDATRWRVV